MHSATKYLNGHTDVTAGCVAGDGRDDRTASKKMRRKLGSVLDPQPAYALGAGPEDAAAAHRAPQRERDGGRPIARSRPPRAPGLLPGLASASGPRDRRAHRCADSAGWSAWKWRAASKARHASSTGSKLIKRATSLGGVESLASLPVLTSQWNYSRRGTGARGRDSGDGAPVGRPRGRPKTWSPISIRRSGRAPVSPVPIRGLGVRWPGARGGTCSARSAMRPAIAGPSRSPNFSRKDSNGTTALAIARWPPALPMSANHFHELTGVARVAEIADRHDERCR